MDRTGSFGTNMNNLRIFQVCSYISDLSIMLKVPDWVIQL